MGRFRGATLLLSVLRVGIPFHAKVGTSGFHEADVGDAVVACDLEGAHPLLSDIGREGAAEYGRVVREDHAFDARDDTDAEYGSAADHIVRVVSRERTDFEEGAVGIEGEGDALADGELPSLREAGMGLGAAASFRLVEQSVDLRESLEHDTSVLGKLLGSRVERRLDRGSEQGGLHGLSNFWLTRS